MTHRHRLKSLLIVVLAMAAACAYTSPSPTAPTVEGGARAPVSFAIQALPLANRIGAAVNLKAWASDGTWADIDATCASDHGTFEQPRVRSSAPASLVLTGSSTLTRVTCRTDNGLTAWDDVDLSAWAIAVHAIDEQLDEDFRSRTFITFRVEALQPGLPLLTREIHWGDGAVEPWLTQTAFSTHLTFVHKYARTGTFTVTPRITWAGGALSLPFLIERRCQVFASWSDGLCSTTWRIP